MIERYNELYADMAGSSDPEKMKAFGSAERWAFHQAVSSSPQLARLWLDKIEAGRWNNYLSEQEASEIVSGLVSQDGRKGPRWSRGQIESLGMEMQREPYFNPYALCVTMNMIASDHMSSLREYLPEEDIPGFVYRMSVEKLTDPDRPRFIRPYFGL